MNAAGARRKQKLLGVVVSAYSAARSRRMRNSFRVHEGLRLGRKLQPLVKYEFAGGAYKNVRVVDGIFVDLARSGILT